LTGSTGAWSGTPPLSYQYQWQRCTSSCTPIPAATSSSYTLTTSDTGAKIALSVTASNTAGTGSATSSELGPVIAVPSPTQVKAALARTLKPSGKAARLRTLVKARGYKLTFAAPGAGRLAIDWFAKPKGKTLLVASATIVFHSGAKQPVRVNLTPKGRKLLQHAKRVKITIKATFTPTGGATTTSTKTVTLKR
jgi:hypothetical protein